MKMDAHGISGHAQLQLETVISTACVTPTKMDALGISGHAHLQLKTATLPALNTPATMDVPSNAACAIVTYF